MKNKKAALFDAEWKIMRLLWEQSPLSCRQIEGSLVLLSMMRGDC